MGCCKRVKPLGDKGSYELLDNIDKITSIILYILF